MDMPLSCVTSLNYKKGMNTKTYKLHPLGKYDLLPYTSPLEVLDFDNANLNRMAFTHLGNIHEFTQKMPFTATVGQLDSLAHSPKIVLLEYEYSFDVVKELSIAILKPLFPTLSNNQWELYWAKSQRILSLIIKLIKWSLLILLTICLCLKIR